MTKFAIIIPDRSDRPRLLENCLRMVKRQTIQPDHIELVNYPAKSKEKDITQRYRIGYENLCGKGYDVIFFIENDDYYSPDYFEVMLEEWEKAKRPELFGLSFSIYYHIKLFAYFKMTHWERSPSMSTMIKPDLTFTWCPDHEPYTDTHLWMASELRGSVFTPKKMLAIGIKHGEGMTGGDCHKTRLDRFYINKGVEDKDKAFLKMHCDQESFNFYSNYFPNEQTK